MANLLKLIQKIATKLGYDEATDSIDFNADNLRVKDPFLVINHGETGIGVTATQAGLNVDRGAGQAEAQCYYHEGDDAWAVKNAAGDIVNLHSLPGKIANAGDTQTRDTLYWLS